MQQTQEFDLRYDRAVFAKSRLQNLNGTVARDLSKVPGRDDKMYMITEGFKLEKHVEAPKTSMPAWFSEYVGN